MGRRGKFIVFRDLDKDGQGYEGKRKFIKACNTHEAAKAVVEKEAAKGYRAYISYPSKGPLRGW